MMLLSAKQKRQNLDAQIYLKQGTTQNQVDARFAGYNPDLVAVLGGFDQPQSCMNMVLSLHCQ